MGKSVRSKFKREIRSQRRATETESEKEKAKHDAVQMALERAAAAPKIPVANTRARVDIDNAGNDNISNQFDKDTVSAIEEAHQESINAARWGITAPAMLKTKRGKVIKNEKGRQGGKAKLTAAASFSNDSRKRKDQKKLVKAVASMGR